MNLFLCSYTAGVKKILSCFLKPFNIKEILFIPTAGNVENYREYITQAQKVFEEMGFKINVMDIAKKEELQITKSLEKAQALYISGGNTFYLLQELKRKHMIDKIKDRISAGMPYIGESAGAIIAHKTITYNEIMDDRKMAVELKDDKALGIFSHAILPHFGDQPFVDTSKLTFETFKDLVDLIPINNKEAVIVKKSGYEIRKEL